MAQRTLLASSSRWAHPIKQPHNIRPGTPVKQRVLCKASPEQRGSTLESNVEEEMLADVDGAGQSEQQSGSSVPFGFLCGVSSFGLALTGYLLWTKLTNSGVVCPTGGCSSILSSPYAMIGPVPLPALGTLGYGTVAGLSWLGSRTEAAAAPAQLQQGLLLGTSVLAGTSIALAFTLRARFPGEFCAYCFASIAASLTLYFTTYFSSSDDKKAWSFGSMAATVIAILGLYSTYPPVVSAGTFNVPYQKPAVETESLQGAVALASQLRDKGAKMYGAFWCSHCNSQKRLFGQDAQEALPYVECYPEGYQGPGSIAKACKDAKIDGFPTWIIQGQKLEGDWSLEALQAAADGASAAEVESRFGR